jgi:hypothetical protein
LKIYAADDATLKQQKHATAAAIAKNTSPAGPDSLWPKIRAAKTNTFFIQFDGRIICKYRIALLLPTRPL